jgi:hypothetical protein
MGIALRLEEAKTDPNTSLPQFTHESHGIVVNVHSRLSDPFVEEVVLAISEPTDSLGLEGSQGFPWGIEIPRESRKLTTPS